MYQHLDRRLALNRVPNHQQRPQPTNLLYQIVPHLTLLRLQAIFYPFQTAILADLVWNVEAGHAKIMFVIPGYVFFNTFLVL
jgi:hypothetical protein